MNRMDFRTLVILSMAVTLTLGHGNDSASTPIPLKPLSTKQIENFGESVNLTCDHKSSGKVKYWQLTDLSTIELTSTNSNPRMLSQGKLMQVTDIKEWHIGSYYCIVQDNNKLTNYSIQLRLRPRTQWELYRMNVIVGCSATAIFIILMATVLLLYHFRWQDPAEKEAAAHRHDAYPQKLNIGTANMGYTTEVANGAEKYSMDTRI